MSPFEDFVDVDDLSPEERDRLRRMHEVLLEVGPPPELTASLQKLPAGATRARVIPFPARRRLGAAVVLAAAIAAAAFGGGYLAGNSSSGLGTVRVAAMTGKNALGSLQVGRQDRSGNWPLRFRVSGLPKLAGKYAYYELFVLRHGKPRLPCGGFRVKGTDATTSVTFTVPYEITGTTRWVLTAIDHGHRWPGRVVMT